MRPARPWTSAWLVGNRQSSDFSVTLQVQDLLSALRVQFGVSSDTTAFLFRLVNLQVWGSLEVKSNEALAAPFRMTVSFYDPNETEGYAVLVGTDVGTATVPARVGIHYGVIKSQNIISAGDVSKKIATIQPTGFNSQATQVDYTVAARVLWTYATAA